MRIKIPGAWLLALVSFLWVSSTMAHGAISVGAVGGVLSFETAPAASEFATMGVPGDGATYVTVGSLDAAVGGMDARLITNALTSSSSYPPTTSGLGFRHNTTLQVLQSRPAGVAAVVLKATLRNDTGGNVAALPISYDLAKYSAIDPPRELPGHYVYWSLSGEPGSWTRVDALSGLDTTERVSAVIPLANWQPNTELYLLWVDDNADSATDPAHTLDNFFFGFVPGESGGIPVPAGGTGILTFDTMPTNTHWSTLSVTGLASEITIAAELDARVQLLEAVGIDQPLRISGAIPPSGHTDAKWSSSLQCLATRPASCAFQVLMATLRNDTGRTLESLQISYTLADVLPAGTTNLEEVAGQRVFFSKTGASNTWQLIPEFSNGNTGKLTATLQVALWPPNGRLYLLWADDNGSADANLIGNEEGAYTIDDFQVMPPISLRVRTATSSMVELTWPYPSEGFQLQGKASLDGAWQPVVAQDVPGGGWHRVLVDVGTGSMFYRLVK